MHPLPAGCLRFAGGPDAVLVLPHRLLRGHSGHHELHTLPCWAFQSYEREHLWSSMPSLPAWDVWALTRRNRLSILPPGQVPGQSGRCVVLAVRRGCHQRRRSDGVYLLPCWQVLGRRPVSMQPLPTRDLQWPRWRLKSHLVLALSGRDLPARSGCDQCVRLRRLSRGHLLGRSRGGQRICMHRLPSWALQSDPW